MKFRRRKISYKLIDPCLGSHAAAFAAKAMKEAALLAKTAAFRANESYPLSQVTGHLQRMVGPNQGAIMLRERLKPLAGRAKALCDRDQMAAKAQRRAVRSGVEQGGVVLLPLRKPSRLNVDDDSPDGAA